MAAEENAILTYVELLAELGMSRHLGDLEATQELAELCHIERDKVILDVGCGIGRTPCYVAKMYGCKVVGVDISEKMVDWSRKRAPGEGVENMVEFRVADAQDLPFEDGSFDVVINESVLAFVKNRRKALSEYVRVTRPGGHVGLNESSWIKTPVPDEVVQYFSSDMFAGVRMETVDTIERLLVESGLKDIKVSVHRTTARGDTISRLRYYGPRGIVLNVHRILSLYASSSAGRGALKEILSKMPRSPKNLYDHYGYAIYVGRKSPL